MGLAVGVLLLYTAPVIGIDFTKSDSKHLFNSRNDFCSLLSHHAAQSAVKLALNRIIWMQQGFFTGTMGSLDCTVYHDGETKYSGPAGIKTY